MDRIKEAYRKDSEKWNTIIGMILSAISIIISILSMIINPNNLFIAISIIACQIIVLVFCIISLQIIFKSRNALNSASEQVALHENSCQERISALNTQLEQQLKLIDRLVTFDKNINKRINNFLTLVCDESDLYFHNVAPLKKKRSQISCDNKELIKENEEQQKKERKRFEESVFALYNRYIKGVFEEVTNIILAYLKTAGTPEQVSLSLKLFDVTFSTGIDPSSLRIITAFRDKTTYETAKREIGERHYSVSQNGDFQQCLTKESYIRNNIPEGAEDYANENFPNSLRFYNSTVVVPIICDYKSDRNVFGYLCCDALNTNPSIELFDKKVSDIMYTAALTIGMFFDTVNSCWDFSNEENNTEFLTYIHDKCYKATRR